MRITIPENLNECSLGQLVAFADFATIVSKEGERSIEDSERLEEAVLEICNQPQSVIGSVSKMTMDSIINTITESFATVSKDIVRFSKASNMNPVFECVPEEWHIIQAEYLEASSLKKIRLKRRYKKQAYEVVGNPETLPSQIWTHLLDNVMKKRDKVKPEQFWKEWLLIPRVLSCVAWGAKESVITKNNAGEVVVDFARIDKMEKVFMQVPAKVGLSAYGFFLATQQISSSVNHSIRSAKK